MLTGLTRRIVRTIGNLFGNRDERKAAAMPKPERPKREAPLSWSVKFWASNGRSFFGPVGSLSGEYSHVSRQTCRAYLRALAFRTISQQQPLWSRRDRRRYSRAAAGLEYIRMMEDKTNMVENEKELLAVTA